MDVRIPLVTSWNYKRVRNWVETRGDVEGNELYVSAALSSSIQVL